MCFPLNLVRDRQVDDYRYHSKLLNRLIGLNDLGLEKQS